MTFRLHGWSATRWWWWASLLTVAAILSTQVPEWAIPVTAAAAGLLTRWKTPLRYGWVISAPLTFALAFIGWRTAAELIVVAAFLWALVQTFEWSATSIEVKGGILIIGYGLFWPRTVRVPQRQIQSMQTDRGPFNLYSLLGFVHLRWDTAGQVEFQDQLRYATPGLAAALEV